MKWENRGHEFDIVYDNIIKKEGFYLFGAGHDGRIVFEIIQEKYAKGINLLGFIDNEVSKQGTTCCGLKVFAPEEIDFSDSTAGIIISISASVTSELESQLSGYGLVKGEDFFHYYVFLTVWAGYRYGEAFLPTVSFLPCTKCNLTCEACLNFTPYIKKFTERSWEDVKDDIDLFFSVVDYVGLFHISGGEPMLYTYIGELISYISEKYGDKIFSLETVTNGTVIPNQGFLQAVKMYDILITVDDYRDSLPEYREVFNQTINMLYEAGGIEKVVVKKYDEWIDLLGLKDIEQYLDEEQLIKKYNDCHVPWQEYKNGKLYTCNYAAYAAVAEIIHEIDSGEYYDLRKHDKSKLKELMEFRLGYSENGYASFCKMCAGFIEINPYKVTPAKQTKRGR